MKYLKRLKISLMTLKIMHRGMERNLFVLLLLLAFPLFSVADFKAEESFEKANGLYANAKYKEAAASYQQVLDSGYVLAEVYFNLGNAFYKLGEIPQAIWNYERAYKLSPGDEDIQINIQLANLKIKDKIEAVPEFFLAKWWRSFILFSSVQTLSLLSVWGFLLGFALLIVYLLSASVSVKKPAFYAGVAVLVLALVLIFMAGQQVSYLESSSKAIVFAGTVNVKSGPKDSFKTLFVIHEGIKVGLKEQTGGWVKVELPNGSIGWIEAKDLKEI